MSRSAFRKWMFLFLALPVLAAAPFQAAAQDVDELQGEEPKTTVADSVYGRVEYFIWEEWEGNDRLLQETGPRFAVGLNRTYMREQITFSPRLELFYGGVDYDGQLQDGTPHTTDTRYAGGKAEADVGNVFLLSNGYTLEPYVSLGYTRWNRKLKGNGGYTEKWDSFYARGGLRGEGQVTLRQRPVRLYAEAGLKIPLSTYNRAILPGIGKTTVSPKGYFTPFAGFGVRHNRWSVGLSYDAWRFHKSDEVDIGGGFSVLQPKSIADIYGLNVAYSF